MTTNDHPFTMNGALQCLRHLFHGRQLREAAPDVQAELVDLLAAVDSDERPFAAFVGEQVREREQGGEE